MSDKSDRFKNLELDDPGEIKTKKTKSKRRLEIFGLPEKKQRKQQDLHDITKPIKFKKGEVLDPKERPTEKVEKKYIESRNEKSIRVKKLRKKRIDTEQRELEKILAKQKSEEAKAKAKKNVFKSIGRVLATGMLPIGIILMRSGIARSHPFFILFMVIAFVLQLFFGDRESRRNFWRRY